MPTLAVFQLYHGMFTLRKIKKSNALPERKSKVVFCPL